MAIDVDTCHQIVLFFLSTRIGHLGMLGFWTHYKPEDYNALAISTPSCHHICTKALPARVHVRLVPPPEAWSRRWSRNQSWPWWCNVLEAQLCEFLSLLRCSLQLVTLFRQVSIQRPCCLASEAAARFRLITNEAASSLNGFGCLVQGIVRVFNGIMRPILFLFVVLSLRCKVSFELNRRIEIIFRKSPAGNEKLI